MAFRTTQYRTNHRATSSRFSPLRSMYGLTKIAVFLMVAGFACWFGIQLTVQDQLRDRVHSEIECGLIGTGLQTTLGQARFHEGKGIQLNNLSLESELGQNSSQVSSEIATAKLDVYEAFLHATSTMVDLASQELDIKHVEFRRAKLTLKSDTAGNWQLDELFQSLSNIKNNECAKAIPFSITDSQIVLVDQSDQTSPPRVFTDVNLYIQPIEYEGRPLLQIHGNVSGKAISNVQFTTYLDKQSNWWHANVATNEATISRDLFSGLPESIQQTIGTVPNIRGKVAFSATASGPADFATIPSFSIKGQTRGLSVDDPSLPQRFRDVSGKFEFNNNGFHLSEFTGQMGSGNFFWNYQQTGLLERETWSWDGHVNGFEMKKDNRMANWLPEYFQNFCSEYSPQGTSNIKFDLRHDGNTLKRDILGHLTNMTFEYFKMPYLIENCAGKVHLKDDICKFDVRSITAQQVIDIDGIIKDVGKDATFQMNITVPGELPFDQKLLTALDAQPKIAKVIRAFNGAGYVGGIGRIERQIPKGKVKKSFDFRLKQCSIRHNSFDYPIYNINGLVQSRDMKFTFSDLTGNNSSGQVGCNGTWDPTNGLNARFLCSSVPLDDQLRFALKPEIREIWNGFRPRGTLDFIRVDMTLPIDAPNVDLQVEATMKNDETVADGNYVSIHPVWFPYEIQHLTGVVNVGSGKVKLTNMKGKHQRTWVVCQGDGRYSDQAWSVRLKDLLVGSLKVDEDLMSALPGQLGKPIRQLKYDGLLNVSGEMTIAGKKGQSSSPKVQLASYKSTASFSPIEATSTVRHATSNLTNRNDDNTNLAWNLRFDMNQARMIIGLPIENVFGMVNLIGQYDGNYAACKGSVDIDSLTVLGAQVTQVKGPIWIDENRAGAGFFAHPNPTTETSNVSPIAEQMESPPLSGKLQHGTVKFDAQTTFGSQGQFYLQGTLDDGCLATACRELAPNLTGIEGSSFAAFRMAGDYTGSHSYRGDGTIQLRDAKISELPLFLSLLKILRVRQPDRTAFDSSNIDFTIQGESIDFNRMEFLGDAVSLIGNGKMNLDRDIDLNFYSIMGRNRINIPLITDLYRASSQKILWINVDGNLDDPKTHKRVLPQLNDSLKQLFKPNDSNFEDRLIGSRAARSSRYNSPQFR